MMIELTVECEQLVRSFVQGGRYTSEAEVIDEALRLLRDRDGGVELADLRREIAIGAGQADRGELGPFDPEATLARVRSRHTPTTGSS